MKMSVTRALAEVKLLDSRINRAIINGTFVSAGKSNGMGLKIPKKKEDIEIDIKSSFDSAVSLINRREKIKRAIIKSNSFTLVTINGQEMTVAEAIEFKDSIKYRKGLLGACQTQWRQTIKDVNDQNARVEEEINKRALSAYGSDKSKITQEQESYIRESVKKDNEASFINPKNIEAVIAKLESDIDGFLTEVDFVLSESNSSNYIEIED